MFFSYKSLLETCKNSGLDPYKKGTNPWKTSRPISVFDEPFNLRKIDFPKEELREVLLIGRLINNLISQESLRHFYGPTKEDKQRYKRDKGIKEFIPIAEASQESWLKKGLEKCDSNKAKGIVLSAGIIYMTNPEMVERQKRMDKQLAEFRRDSIIKQRRSEESASKVLITD